MAGAGTDFGRDDLVERLLGFDDEVALRFPGSRFELLIVGGGGLALLRVLPRPTSDIDVLCPPAVLGEIMERYDINGRVGAYDHNYPFNRDDRRELIDIPTAAVTCYVASLEDIVAAKLCSLRDQDESDLRIPQIVERIDWDRLAAVADEMPRNLMNDRQVGEFQQSYDRYVQECKPCDS